jgi:hypothetical protein
MVSDEPDVDGNISAPLDEDADNGITLLTGAWDPDVALLRARGHRVTWSCLIAGGVAGNAAYELIKAAVT